MRHRVRRGVARMGATVLRGRRGEGSILRGCCVEFGSGGGVVVDFVTASRAWSYLACRVRCYVGFRY